MCPERKVSRGVSVLPQRGSQAKSVEISGGGRRAVVTLEGGEPVLRGKGVKLVGFTPHPTQGGGEPQTQGFFGRLFGMVRDALGPVGDLLEGIAAGLAWLVGAEFSATFWGGRGEIWVDKGTIIVGYDGGSGFMPPPPGTEEDPGVWY